MASDHVSPSPFRMTSLRFRAWHTATEGTKKMIDLHAITPFALDPNLKQDGVFIPFDDRYIIMQSTGLKDKNGKEIFEGDIVLLGSSPFAVTWHKMTAQWELAGLENAELWPLYQLPPLEVIGNIHDNPSLMKT
jgi:hypothetical protein